ncbi:hypothetical protein ABVK25_009228 [Lepraria finkii]|uniref:Uncharacterized protein n=1 Tax=Lepraria finkii TaxID=1340010 RepID=A0ABR4B424_9LECA
MMEQVQTFNPFVQHESRSRNSLITYRILALLSLLITVSVSIGLTIKAPSSGKTIWDQNETYPTPFSLSPHIISAYWIMLFALQLGYIYILYVFNTEHINRAANVRSHSILHNLLQSPFSSYGPTATSGTQRPCSYIIT